MSTRTLRMRYATALLAATALGIAITVVAEAVAQSNTPECASSTDVGRLNKRFDDLEQAIAALQSQAGKAASDEAQANLNSQRQLANISSQVAAVNTQVVALSGRVR
jgi:outer membrane murein-binding lipoprotein Lpp